MVLSLSSKPPPFTDESTRFSLSIASTALGIFVAHVIFTYLSSESLDIATTTVPPQVLTTTPHLKLHMKATKGILPIVRLRSQRSKDSEGSWENLEKLHSQPKVWVVTPTYRRDDQFMSLTRTFQALYPARHFINWVIVDQIEHSTERQFARLKKFLRRFSISTRLIRSQPRQKSQPSKGIKGVEGRRAAVEYLRSLPPEVAGRSDVVFFADDDNVYDSDIFRQIRQTETVSMWPAAALDEYYLITPVLGNNGTILTVFGGWKGGRKYPVDFAQFAISLQLLREKTNVTIPYAHSQMENAFLEQLGVPLALMKPLGFHCLKIMAWHTKHHVIQGQRSRRIQIINLVRSNAVLNSTNLHPWVSSIVVATNDPREPKMAQWLTNWIEGTFQVDQSTLEPTIDS